MAHIINLKYNNGTVNFDISKVLFVSITEKEAQIVFGPNVYVVVSKEAGEAVARELGKS